MTQRRLAALRSAMSAHRLQVLLVTEMAHVRYLTGFSGSSGICILTPQNQIFITDRRYQSQAPQEVVGFSIVIAKQNLFPVIAEKSLVQKQARIGFESEYVSVADMKSLRKLLPNRIFVPTTKILENVSAVKDDGEIALIRYAAHITDKVFQKILLMLRPGVRECDVAAEISYWHRRYGAECDAFDPIVASGARGALPHARASEKKIKHHEMVVLDFGCRYSGYHSDLTRTVAVGRPPAQMKKVYRIVLDAQMKAIDRAHHGIAARLVDAAARKHIRQAGYGKNFIHSLGHGLGLHVHEPLRLSAISTAILETGNVMTIEPGIYLPEIGGVRIEDDIVIQENGCKVLTESSKELIIV